MLMMMLMMIVMEVAAAKTVVMMMMVNVMLTVVTAMTTSGMLVAIRSRESTNMAHVSLSFHRCEFCGAYHLMTSAWLGEYFIMDPYTNTVPWCLRIWSSLRTRTSMRILNALSTSCPQCRHALHRCEVSRASRS